MTAFITNGAIEHFTELLATRHLESTQALLAEAIERRQLFFGGRPISHVLRPFFIEEEAYAAAQRAAGAVVRALTIVHRRLSNDREFRKRLALSEADERLLEMEPGGPTEISGRLDGFIGTDGVVRFIEFNSLAAGIVFNDELATLFAGMPVMREFEDRYSVRSVPTEPELVSSLLEGFRRRGGIGAPRVALLAGLPLETSSLQITESLRMAEIARKVGCEIVATSPDGLGYANGKLLASGAPIDVVFVDDWPAILRAIPFDRPFWKAVRERAVWLGNSFSAKVVRGDKAVFSLLTDPDCEKLFDAETVTALRRHVPWTRNVVAGATTHHGETVDLLEFVARNRERLVLKPADDYGGRGVYLGWECDDARWAEGISRAIGTRYVVQERVPTSAQPFPSIVDGELRIEDRYFDFNPFIWSEDRPAGGIVRLSRSALMNVTAGGGSLTPLCIVSPR
jgi:hypothetical protein